jgi:hypothetical protein
VRAWTAPGQKFWLVRTKIAHCTSLKAKIMKQAIKAFIKRLPFIRDLIQQVKNQEAFPA